MNSRLSHKEGKGEQREAGIRKTRRGQKREFRVEVKEPPFPRGAWGCPPVPAASQLALPFFRVQGLGGLGLQWRRRASFIALSVPAYTQVRLAASESELQPLNMVLLLTPLI